MSGFVVGMLGALLVLTFMQGIQIRRIEAMQGCLVHLFAVQAGEEALADLCDQWRPASPRTEGE